jgi:hypothetical protein
MKEDQLQQQPYKGDDHIKEATPPGTGTPLGTPAKPVEGDPSRQKSFTVK